MSIPPQVSFESETLIQVYMILNQHVIPDGVLDPKWNMEWTQSEMI